MDVGLSRDVAFISGASIQASLFFLSNFVAGIVVTEAITTDVGCRRWCLHRNEIQSDLVIALSVLRFGSAL